ncbi:discoidin domain-containing protein [Myxococcota bacterium]|nr:discoidin domain-containing protein [Myxococcota bacterium]
MLAGGCEQTDQDVPELDLAGLALITAPNGFYFFPPLAPEPTASAPFVSTHLAHLAVELVKTDASGAWGPALVRFDQSTSPRLALKPEGERYVVNFEPKPYFLDRTATYRFRVMDGNDELATAEIPSRIHEFLDRWPNFRMTLAFRIEAAAVDRDDDGIENVDDGCPDVYDPTNTLPIGELCDGVDNDCNGEVDDGLPDVTCGVGACEVTMSTCANGATQYCVPGEPQTEACNGIDDDCDGTIDDGVLMTSYRDGDGDGYGVPQITAEACSIPGGFADNPEDCDDTRADVHPGAAEICGDNLDNDCDGAIDEGCYPFPANGRGLSAYTRSFSCLWAWGLGTLDGNTAISFSGAGIPPGQYWQIDMGAPRRVSRFAANAYSTSYGRGGMRSFRIDYSNDGVTWSTAYFGTHPDRTNVTQVYTFPMRTARYWRHWILSSYMTTTTSCGAGQYQGSFQFRE